ncbi:hypothetical protein C0991_001942 [Blastosporella zonata]|nr:hypothetical protein C0991_001942 [Blastosporella zonata]
MHDEQGRKRKAAPPAAPPKPHTSKKHKKDPTTATPKANLDTPTNTYTAPVTRHSTRQQNASSSPSASNVEQHVTRSKTGHLKPSRKRAQSPGGDRSPPPAKHGLSQFVRDSESLRKKVNLEAIARKKKSALNEVIEISDSDNEDERPRKRQRRNATQFTPRPKSTPKPKESFEPEVIDLITSDDDAPAPAAPAPPPKSKLIPKSNPKAKPLPLPKSTKSTLKSTHTPTPAPVSTPRPLPTPIVPRVRAIDLRQAVASSSSHSRPRAAHQTLRTPKAKTLPSTPARGRTRKKGMFADESDEDVHSLPAVHTTRYQDKVTKGIGSGSPEVEKRVEGVSGKGKGKTAPSTSVDKAGVKTITPPVCDRSPSTSADKQAGDMTSTPFIHHKPSAGLLGSDMLINEGMDEDVEEDFPPFLIYASLRGHVEEQNGMDRLGEHMLADLTTDFHGVNQDTSTVKEPASEPDPATIPASTSAPDPDPASVSSPFLDKKQEQELQWAIYTSLGVDGGNAQDVEDGRMEGTKGHTIGKFYPL